MDSFEDSSDEGYENSGDEEDESTANNGHEILIKIIKPNLSNKLKHHGFPKKNLHIGRH